MDKVVIRPWGSFETLLKEDGIVLKKIIVKPGERLSLQSHQHRSEHWVILKGLGYVTIENREFGVKKNGHIYIGIGEKHRIENVGKMDLEIYETQIGDYLEEDDIERFSDDYGRVADIRLSEDEIVTLQTKPFEMAEQTTNIFC